MSLPETQKTGALAEDDVAQLFLSWNWVWGRDRIDIGYDLSVAPDHELVKGGRFLVQVKGTTKKSKGAVSAPVSKSRLREYAENVLPVFLVRVSAEGDFYWLHAQEWARLNQKRLSGNGDSVVQFDPQKKLSDKQSFQEYVVAVMRPLAERKDGLSELAKERTRHLNSIDDRFSVRVGMKNGQEQVEIFARSEAVKSSFKFSPSPGDQNIASLKEAIEFGLPASVEVDTFRMEGSKLFDEIGAGGEFKGTIKIQSNNQDKGSVHIYPGAKHSIAAPELVIPAILSRGNRGAAISGSDGESLVDLSIRMTSENGRGKARVNIKLDAGKLAKRPIKFHAEMAAIAVWADQVLAKEYMRIELWFLGVRAPLDTSSGFIEEMSDFLEMARAIGRLHQVARTLDSELTLAEDFGFSEEDFSDIYLAYVLLKGEKRAINFGPVEFEPSHSFDSRPKRDFVITTSIMFTICGQSLGVIPVAIELPSAAIEAVPNTSRYRLSQAEGSSAWISYDEDGVVDDGIVRRISPPRKQ